VAEITASDSPLIEALGRGLHADRLLLDADVHPLLITPPGDAAARRAAQAAFEEFLDAAIALRGTVTGEHGVGILKRDGMRRELDPGALALQTTIRHALDPRGLFNPGKG
jgi:glycolate oxidase